MSGRWAIWLRKPEPETRFRPLTREGDGLNVQLVHWTGDGADSETECRSVEITVTNDGGVTIELSVGEGGEGVQPTHITRFDIPGWEDWPDEETR